MHLLNSAMIVLVVAGVLSACGGGGGGTAGDDGNTGGGGGDDGGGNPPAAGRQPLALNANNGQRVAQKVVANSDDLAGSGVIPGFSVAAMGVESGGLPSVQALVYDIALDAIESHITAGSKISAAEVQTINCDGGGTITITGTEQQGSFTYDDCRTGTVVQNGIIALKLTSAQGDPNSNHADWSLNFTVAFTNFSVSSDDDAFSLQGGFTLAADYNAATDTFTLATSGSELRYTEGGATARLINFTFEDTETVANSQHQLTYSFMYDASDLAGTVTVVTNVAFTASEGFPPESGRLTITGANGTRVAVGATGGGTAKISVDANGDGDFTDSEDKVINDQWMTFFG